MDTEATSGCSPLGSVGLKVLSTDIIWSTYEPHFIGIGKSICASWLVPLAGVQELPLDLYFQSVSRSVCET